MASHIINKALIVASGRGSRLDPVLDNKPKPLVQVSEYTLIEQITQTAYYAGIGDFLSL